MHLAYIFLKEHFLPISHFFVFNFIFLSKFHIMIWLSLKMTCKRTCSRYVIRNILACENYISFYEVINLQSSFKYTTQDYMYLCAYCLFFNLCHFRSPLRERSNLGELRNNFLILQHLEQFKGSLLVPCSCYSAKWLGVSHMTASF